MDAESFMHRSDDAAIFLFKTPFKNMNLYWLGFSGLAAWFLLVHTPAFLLHYNRWKDLLLIIHIAGAGGIVFACVHNALVTPSIHRTLHIAVGRIGLLLGIAGFLTGLYLVWGRHNPDKDQTFGIMITIAGVLQMQLQYKGYLAIKKYQRIKQEIAILSSSNEEGTLSTISRLRKEEKSSLKCHIESMIALFVMACGIPAFIRVLDGIPGGNLWILLSGIGIFNVLCFFYAQHVSSRVDDTPPYRVDEPQVTETASLLT